MSAQISKSKPPSATTPTSKYQRRADLERERQQKYSEEQARLEFEKEERAAKKRKLEDEDAARNAAREEKKRRLAEESRVRRGAEEVEEERLRRKRLGLPELLTDTAEVEKDIEDDELRIKLRGLGQEEAIGEEGHAERLARYYRIKKRKDKEKKWYAGAIPTTIEPLPADELILPEKLPSPDDKDAYAKLHRQISSYLNFVLGEWGAALTGRDKDVASSSEGVTASNNYKVALEDLKPLMRRLEAGYREATSTAAAVTRKDGKDAKKEGGYEPLPHKALLQPLVDILHKTQGRNYRDAVDAYLRLSIGKAAWPIGVTMVGIHERSAREKLHEDGKGKDEIAQIMSDETTRKWLQSLKRLVSFAQTRWQVWDLGQLMG